MSKRFSLIIFTVVFSIQISVDQLVQGQTSGKRESPTQELNGRKLDLVFQDDFENGTKNWSTTDDAAWSIKDENGNSRFGLTKRRSDYAPKYRSPHNIALIKDVSVSDFVVTFDVKSTKDTGNHRDCCIFFAYQDPDNFYYVHLGAKPDRSSGQIMIVNNAPRTPFTKNEKPVRWDNNWHKVKLTFDSKSGQIHVYFDDMKEPLISAVDKTFSKGKIGIGSFDDMNDFDNIRVYANQ